jgi:hypothetical protein
VIALALAAAVELADVYATATARWVQGVAGAASTHYGNTEDVAVGFASDRAAAWSWWAGAVVETWFGHAPFGKGPDAANAYVSPGVEAGAAWRAGERWRVGPRVAVAASGWSNAGDDSFGGRRTGVPPVVTLGVRAVWRARWLAAVDVVIAASPTPDAPAPDDRGGASIAFGVGVVLR